MKWYSSFRVRIFLMIYLLIFSSLSLLFFYISDRMTTIAKQDAYDRVTSDCMSLRNQIDLPLAGMEVNIYQLAISDAVQKMDLVEIDRISQNLIQKLPTITQIYIMDKYGMQIYKSSFPETMGDRSDRDYFKDAMTGKSVFSEAIISRSTLVPITVQAQPIFRNGSIDGVIGASIDLGFLSTVASNIGSSRTEYGFIVDSTGRTIGHPEQKYVEEMLDVSYMDPVADVISGKTGTGSYIFDGVEKLVAYIPSSQTDWGILVQIFEKEAFETVVVIRNILIVSALFFMLTSIIATYLVSNHLEKPLKRIVDTIKNIETNLHYPAYRSTRKDEFGIIENELASIADVIHKTQNELEERVEARTDELNKTMIKLMETQEKLEKLSLTDNLTGLSNRRALDQYLENLWKLLSRQNSVSFCFLMIDIDYFKKFNDTYGHQKGDICLKAVSNCLDEQLRRQSDFMGRYGGEEFLVILNNISSTDMLRLAEVFRQAIQDLKIPNEGSPVSDWVSISIGGVCINEMRNKTPESAIASADKMLYEAKNSGRNKVVIEDEEIYGIY